MSDKPYVVVDHEQGSQEWLEWRSKAITATDSVILMEKSPYGGTPLQLYRIKKGSETPEDLDRNPNVRRGKEMEPEIRREIEAKFKDQTGDMLFPLCVQSTKGASGPLLEYPIAASLDGITDDDEPVEMKAPHKNTWEAVMSEGVNSSAYQMYRIQVQHQLLVTGAKKGHLVFGYREKKGEELELLRFEINADPVIQQEIQSRAEVFAQSLVSDTPPAADPEKDVFMPANDFDMRRWVTASNKLKHLEGERERLSEHLSRIKAEMDEERSILCEIKSEFKVGECHGVRIASVERIGAIDYKALLKDHLPNLGEDVLERYRKPGSTSTRLTFTEREQAKNVNDQDVKERLDLAAHREGTSFFNW